MDIRLLVLVLSAALECVCFRDRRIVSGLPFEGARFAGDVSLRLTKDSTHICGGVLIHPRWILTAAHCTSGRMTHEFHALVGRIERRYVEKIFTKTYNPRAGNNDIAMLRIRETLLLDVIPLPTADYQPSGTCRVFGFGATSKTGASASSPSVLNQAQVDVVPRDLCTAAIAPFQELPRDTLCAGGGPDACQGDSGSPLVCVLEDGSPVLAGIVSAGFYGCATPGVPGVYSSVAVHRDWIDWVLGLGERDGAPFQRKPIYLLGYSMFRKFL